MHYLSKFQLQKEIEQFSLFQMVGKTKKKTKKQKQTKKKNEKNKEKKTPEKVALLK